MQVIATIWCMPGRNVIMNDIRLRGPDAGAAELLPSSSATTRPDPSVGFPELH